MLENKQLKNLLVEFEVAVFNWRPCIIVQIMTMIIHKFKIQLSRVAGHSLIVIAVPFKHKTFNFETFEGGEPASEATATREKPR